MLSFLSRGHSRKNAGGRGPPAVSGSYIISWWYSDPVLAQAPKSWSLGVLAALACPNNPLPVGFLTWTPYAPGLLSAVALVLALHAHVSGHWMWFFYTPLCLRELLPACPVTADQLWTGWISRPLCCPVVAIPASGRESSFAVVPPWVFALSFRVPHRVPLYLIIALLSENLKYLHEISPI